MNAISYFPLLPLLLCFCCSCSDDKSKVEAVDQIAPIITITSPTDGATVQAGSEVLVSGRIEEESELEQVIITVSHAFYTDSETIPKDALPSKDGNLYKLTQTYQVPENAFGTFAVEVIAEDSQGLTGKKVFTIEVD